MNPNRHKLTSYFGSMSNSDKHVLEKESLKDPMLSDALDAYSENIQALSSWKKMDKKRFRVRRYLLNTALLITSIMVISFMVLNQSSSSSQKKIAQKSPESSLEVKKVTPEKLRQMNQINPHDEIHATLLQSDFKVKDKQTIFQTAPLSNTMNEELVQLPIRSIGKISSASTKRKSNFAMETYIQNLKVLDYRYYRTKRKNEQHSLLTGTPAELESIESNASSREQLEISYLNFLSSTLVDFNRGEYKAALIGFDEILKSYPDDVNALFYSALCLYNLTQFNLCEERLKVMDLVKFDNFDEEQKWYLLLCYRSEGKIEEFLHLKQEIIQNNGFYAAKASAIGLK